MARRLLRIQAVQRDVLATDWRAVGRDIIDTFDTGKFSAKSTGEGSPKDRRIF